MKISWTVEGVAQESMLLSHLEKACHGLLVSDVAA